MASDKNKLLCNTDGVKTQTRCYGLLEDLDEEDNSVISLSPSSVANTSSNSMPTKVVNFHQMTMEIPTSYGSESKANNKEKNGKLNIELQSEQGTSKGVSITNGHGYQIGFQTPPKINELPSTPPQKLNGKKEDETGNNSVDKNEEPERKERFLKKKMSVLSIGSQRDGTSPAMFQDFKIEGPVSVDELENKTPTGMHVKWNFSITKAIPTMPMSVAVACLVLNILVPGSGTIVSAFTVLCVSQNNYCPEDRIIIALVNVLVGFAQMSTVFFMLIGWMWSLMWGCAFVGMATRYGKLSPEIELTQKNSGNESVHV